MGGILFWETRDAGNVDLISIKAYSCGPQNSVAEFKVYRNICNLLNSFSIILALSIKEIHVVLSDWIK